MNVKYRILWVILIIVLLVSALSACTWFNFPTGTQSALIIKDAEIADRLGAKAKLYISANKMPGGGVAAVQVNVGNFSWDPKMVKVLDIGGLNGFTVLAQSFDNDNGTGGFAAVNPSAGVENGNILEIVFKRVIPSNATSSGVEILKDQLLLGDAANNVIGNYALVNGEIRLKD